MRLAVFTNKFPGRINTFFARDMRALIESGIDLDIFPFYPLEPELWSYVPDILNETVLPRARIHHIDLAESFKIDSWTGGKLRNFCRDMIAVNCSAAKFGISRLTKTAYVGLKALAWARRYGNRYDHILAYWGNYAATSAYLFHRLLNRSIPFSMFLHASMDLYEGQVYMREKLLYADNIIVVCDFNQKYLREHYGAIFPRISHKFYKYHLGLDLSEFQFMRDKRPIGKIVAVGGLEKYKGFDFLLRAAHLMRNRGLSYDIDLIGGGKEESSLKRLASELQIEANVHFLGWFTPDKVRTAVSRAAVLVHPSNGIGDAVPTVIKEAMALGTPVIASNLAGIPELLDGGNCGMLVPPGDHIVLASAIETLLKNDELRMTYADKARTYAEKTFDLWRNGQRLADLLYSSTRSVAEVDGGLTTLNQKPAPTN